MDTITNKQYNVNTINTENSVTEIKNITKTVNSNVGNKKYTFGKPCQIFCSNLSIADLRRQKLPGNAIIISSPQYKKSDLLRGDLETPAICMTDSNGVLLPLTFFPDTSDFKLNETTNTFTIKPK